MASQTLCYPTNLPKNIVEIIESDLSIQESSNFNISHDHWINDFIMHYISMANRKNFLYDLSGIDKGSIQYKICDTGYFDNWNTIKNKQIQSNKYIKKLSFYLLLSDSDDYKGGNIQLMNGSGKLYIVPRKRGTLIIFNSTAAHRVLKITEGTKKIIMGDCVGPLWK